MTRKDTEKDSDRPHYYSQFWLDVAAGRRIIGTPKTSDDVEAAENETPELVQRHKGGRTVAVEPEEDFITDEQDEDEDDIVHPVVEPVARAEEFGEPEDLADESIGVDLQDTAVDDIDIPDVDLAPTDAEEEGYDDEEPLEEEEEEDIGWGGRGRKKAKPSRPTKPPVKKTSRRDPRRSGY